MYYYQHHIGDYRRDTGHLSLLEHGVYRQLLDLYYITEKPLNADSMRLISIRTTEERKSFARILTDFFVEKDGLFFHSRCDLEIKKFKGKSEKASASAGARWQKPIDDDANAMRTHSEGNADAMLTINRRTIEPLTKEKKEPKTRYAIPSFVPQDAWDGFVQMRRTGKGVFTERAAALILKQLEAMRAEGQDVAAVLDQSTANGWKGVFPLKQQNGVRQNGKFNASAANNQRLNELIAIELESAMAQGTLDTGVA
jgi:uncharacterized protein YdaU (DUF1376 family)